MSGIEALPWRDYLTFAAAIIGAVLGIMNTWNSLNQRRVRLRVTPKHTISVPDGQRGFAIEVINLSAFAVTVDEVGFEIGGRNVTKNPRAVIAYPDLPDGKPWPRRLEPREDVSVHLNVAHMAVHRGKKIGRAYATTACDETRYGNSPALGQLRKELRK